MKTITVNLYQFSELSDEAKEKAISKLSDINVDYEWWEGNYEDFENLCNELIIDIDLKKTYFNGFYSQGSGSSFNGNFNAFNVIEAIKSKKHINYAPKDAPDLNLPDIDTKVLKLIESGKIDIGFYIKDCNRETSVNCSMDCYISNNVPNIEKEIEKLEEWGQEIADELNNWLYKNLERGYEYLMSNEAIIEAIEANQYDFTEDGNLA